MVFAPEEFANRRLWSRGLAFEEAGQCLHTSIAHDFDAGVEVGDVLTNHRVVEFAVVTSQLDELVEFGTETKRLHGGANPTLETEQSVTDGPTVVHAAKHIVLRATSIGKEDLVEVILAHDVGDRPDLDTWLLHGHEQERDTSMFGHILVSTCKHKDHVGGVARAGPDLLTVDYPFVAV